MGNYSKRAVKCTGAPIGEPQPVRWIDCECGLCVPVGVSSFAGALCDCGMIYDSCGWIIERSLSFAQVREDRTMGFTEPTWENQLIEARKLPTVDLLRHASVSTNNRHRCEDCFCCAALTVMEERGVS